MADDSTVQVKFGADIAAFQDKINVVTSATKGYSQDLVAALNQANLATDAATNGMNAAAAATEGMSVKTAGATREFIVLGREAMTGNFSRIPGSLLVLANRMGGLQSVMADITPATLGWIAAIAGAAVAVYDLANATTELENTQTTVAGALDMAGQSMSYNADEIKQNIMLMREHESISMDDAEKITILFSRNSELTEDMREKLEQYIDAWQQLTGAKDSIAAAENMSKVFSEPAKAAEELAAKYPGLISAADAWRVKEDETANGAQHAAEMLLNDIGPKLDQFGKQYVEPQISWWESLKRVMVEVTSMKPASGGNYGIAQPISAANFSTNQEDVQAQQNQNNLNQQIAAGVALLDKTSDVSRDINKLTQERATLTTAIGASMKTDNLDITVALQNKLQQVNDAITKNEQEANRQAVADAKRAAEQEIEIERDKANTVVQLQKIELQGKRDALNTEVAEGKISKEQELALERQYAQEEYNIDYNALMQELQQENLTAVQKQQIWDRLQVLYAQHQQQMLQLTTKSVQDQSHQYDALFTSIKNASQGMIQGILEGTQTWSTALARIFSNLASQFVEDFVVKRVLNWAESEVQMTAATLAGDAARTASNTAAAGISVAANAAASKSMIGGHAASAAAAVYDDVAQIPLVGWLLAPPAAAAAFVAVEAFGGGVASAAGGFDIPSGVNPLTQLHENEMVLPSYLADNIRNMTSGGGGDTYNVTFQLQSIDSQSGAAWIRANGDVIANTIAAKIRNGNNSLTKMAS